MAHLARRQVARSISTLRTASTSCNCAFLAPASEARAGPSSNDFQQQCAGGRRSLHSSSRWRMEVGAHENNTKAVQAPAVESSQKAQESFFDITQGQETSISQDSAGLPTFALEHAPQIPISAKSQLAAKVTFSAYSKHLENLSFFVQFVLHAAYAFGIPCSRASPLPVKKSLRTVPRSAFVHKPSQENFIKKTHSRYIKLYDADSQTVSDFLGYITENGMEGVSIKANLFEKVGLGFGKNIPTTAESIQAPTDEKVKEMAEQLLESGFGSEEGEPGQTKETTEKEEPKEETQEPAAAASPQS